MTGIYKVIRAVHEAHTTSEPRTMVISLPAPPFGIPATDRSETTPRTMPVRMERLSADDRRWIKSAARMK